jgi:hypothetical protein
MSIHGPLGVSSGGAIELNRRPRRAVAASLGAPRGLLALGGLLVTGVLLVLAAPSTDTLLPESVRPVPAWLAGPFGSTGLNIGTGGLIAVLTLMFVSYVVAVNLADRLSGRAVLATIAALNALVLLAPPLLSTDIFSYQAYARMWVSYGANPYLHGPSWIAQDPLYPYIGATWVNTPSAYGPVFTLLSFFVAKASVAASVLSFKVLAAFSSLGTVVLLWSAARLRGLNPVRTVALFGLNPLVVVYGVGGGHNDLLMLLALSAALWSLLARRERTSGAMIAVATGIKLTAGVFLPFALAAQRGASGTRHRRELVLGFGVAVTAIAVAAVLAFGSGPLHLPATLQQTQAAGGEDSIPGFISTRLGLGGLGHITGYVLGVTFIAVTAWLLRRVWRGQLDWIDGAAWATLAMLVCASSLLPWYVAWLMPLVGLCSDRRLWRWALIFTGVVLGIQLLGYIPHGKSLLGL